MEKHTKATRYIEVIAGKAVHVKRFITIDEQARFLPDVMTLWKEKVDVRNRNSRYLEGLFFDIEHKAGEIPTIKPLLTNLYLVKKLPEFTSFQPRHLIGHRYDLDGTLEAHVDGVQGWAVIVNIGCSAVLNIAQGREASAKKIEVTLKSGDAFIFASDRTSNVLHSVKQIVPGTCPKELRHIAENHRYSFILRDYLATEVASLIEVRTKLQNITLAEEVATHRIWDVSKSFKTQVLCETFPVLPPEVSETITGCLDVQGLSNFGQLSTRTNQFVHLSDDLWRKIYRQVNPKDYNDYKLRTTWEHMTHRALTKKAPPTDALSLVFHFGSINLQCGFAGDELPCAITPNLVKKYEGHYYAGSDVSHIDGGLTIRPFIKREVVSFPALEMMWEHSVSQLQHPLKDDLGTLILMSDMRKDPREKVTQVAFETWDTPMFYMASPQVTCVYATGMTSAIIVDVGYEITSIGVVYEGTILPHLAKNIPVGGSSVDKLLKDQLEKECPELLEHINLESFKKRYCYVKPDRNAKSEMKKQVSVKGKTYSLNSAVLTEPCEALFHPDIFQVSNGSLVEHIKGVMQAVIAEDKELFAVTKVIALSGGPTLHEGFVPRLEHELKEQYPDRTFNIIAGGSRDTASWLGGSILGSLSTFPSMWVSRDNYEEIGPTIVHRKCF